MTGLDLTQLGVSGVIVVIMLGILRTLWVDNKETRKQAHDDMAQVLPALTAASAAMTEFARVALIVLRDSGRDT